MINPKTDILYEDNHLIVINKQAGQLVQADTTGDLSLEDEVKELIRVRDAKPGAVFLGVVHRIDRPVSGCVVFTKTSKALTRLNEAMRNGEFHKVYWAVTDVLPEPLQGELRHHIFRDGKTNKSRAYESPKEGTKEAVLKYKMIAGSTNYYLLEVQLLTGRHHQIRCQLAKIGSAIKGDLKYGSKHSNEGGGISLHARSIEFRHPVTKKMVKVVAKAPVKDGLWKYFEDAVGSKQVIDY